MESRRAPGFVYTVDFVGTPVVHERMHWVACEAISAAAALHCALVNEPVPLAAKATSMAYLEHAYRSAWDYCEQYIIGGGDPLPAPRLTRKMRLRPGRGLGA